MNLTRLSSSSRQDAVVGRQLLRTMFLTPSVASTLNTMALTCCMKYIAPACVLRATTRAQRDPCAPTSCVRFYPKRVLSLKLMLAVKEREERGRMGPRPPDIQCVLEPTDRFAPHDRDRGAEADWSIGWRLCWRARSSIHARAH